jgi:hypothetical protein
MHPGSIDYTYRVGAGSILLDEGDPKLAENFFNPSFCHSERA